MTNRRHLTPEAKAEAERMLADGMTYTAIAAQLEVHSSTVWAALNPERVKERRAKRAHAVATALPPPRKTGACFPWEGVPDEEFV